MKAEIELVKGAYAALNRNDVPGFVKIFTPDVLRVEFPDSPEGGSYRGLEAVTEHVVKGRSSWAEGSCDPQKFDVKGNHIIVSVHVRVRLKIETEWREGDVLDVFTFSDGKVTQFCSFSTEEQALAWV